MELGVDLVVLESAAVDRSTRRALRTLWTRAFGGCFTDEDADHAYGGVHVLASDRGRLVAHASAVPRRIKVGEGPWRTFGYVEAVATDPDRRGEGIGRRTMERLQAEIAPRWPAAFLSTGTATDFYASLGWERWRGLSYTRTGSVSAPDGEEEGLMVLRVDRLAVPDLSVSVTCEDRPGDAW